MSEPSSKPEPVSEVWHFAGRTTLAGGKTGVIWVDASGERLPFACNKRTRAALIGAAYTVQVIRNGEKLSLVGTPVFKPGDRHAMAAEWNATDAAFQIEKDRAALERRHSGDDDYHKPLDALRKIYFRQPPRYRTAMLADIIRTLTNGFPPG